MKKKIKIGFDFDRVFVSYPPIIPSSLIEYLYKKRNHKLSYRIPGKFEQKIRVLSHTSFLRTPIKANITTLKKIFNNDNYEIYLISSRFSFLKKQTKMWDEKHRISKYFEKMYFNFNDKQPHLFKDDVIKKENIEKFVDDDLDLLLFLSKNNPDIEFFWLSSQKKYPPLPANIHQIKNLEELRKKYL